MCRVFDVCGATQRYSAACCWGLRALITMLNFCLRGCKPGAREAHGDAVIVCPRPSPRSEVDSRLAAVEEARAWMASHNVRDGAAYIDPDSFDLSGVGETLGSSITWRRPAEIYSSDFTLWGMSDDASALPEPDDVRQGHLGDCYLIAAMAAIAEEHPERLRSILPATKIQTSGAYAVVLWWMGEWTVVTVDDRFPTFVKSEGSGAAVNTPLCACSRPGRRKLWPLVVEKAFLKLCGGGHYAYCEGGVPGWAMHVLTGAPYAELTLSAMAPEQAFLRLRRAEDAGDVMTAGSATAGFSFGREAVPSFVAECSAGAQRCVGGGAHAVCPACVYATNAQWACCVTAPLDCLCALLCAPLTCTRVWQNFTTNWNLKRTGIAPKVGTFLHRVCPSQSAAVLPARRIYSTVDTSELTRGLPASLAAAAHR